MLYSSSSIKQFLKEYVKPPSGGITIFIVRRFIGLNGIRLGDHLLSLLLADKNGQSHLP